jgi:uncharacterized heparinase superfamily protein
VLALARAGAGAAARDAIAAWIAGNPAPKGDGWHPYPLSTRIGNWIAAVSLCPELLDEVVAASLWRQLIYLERNLEFDVLGNHLIRNARALALGGVFFSAEELRKRGLELLRTELSNQVLPDGGHYERSPVYHALVLRDLLEVRAATGAGFLDDTIERMLAFSSALARPDGLPALFNDGSADLAPTLEVPTPARGVSVFPDTGYVVVRERRIWLAFDCGPPAPAFLPAHAHADALSFQLWVDGAPAVVDPGVSTYAAGSARRRDRGTAAHSTVTVDGADQFQIWGAFRSGPLPQVSLLAAEEGHVAACVSYAGISHTRTLDWSDRELRVHDALEVPGKRTLESRLLLAPSAPVDVAADVEIVRSDGWYSERMFERLPAVVASQRLQAARVASLEWRLTLR